MADIDRLLDPEISEVAARAARVRDFEEIATLGLRRRRRVRAASVAAAVAAAVVVVGGVQLTGGQSVAPTPPATEPTSAPDDKADLTPEQTVTSPDAILRELAVSPDDADVRASVWSLCVVVSCDRHAFALALTDDGFATARYLPLQQHIDLLYLTALDGGRFYLSTGLIDEARIIGTDGSQTSVTFNATASPVRDGEVLVSTQRPMRQEWLALDGEAATAHPIPSPPLNQLREESDGRLVGLGFEPWRAVWSDDGGATWSEHVLPGEPGVSLFQSVPSLRSDTMTFVEGSGGATLFPFIRIHRSTDGGSSWDVVTAPEPDGDRAYLGWAYVREDGSLLSYMDGWSDARRNHPSEHPYGSYRSDGTDWSRLTLIEPGLAEADAGELLASAIRLQELVPGDPATVYVSDADQDGFVSTDGGATWESTPVR